MGLPAGLPADGMAGRLFANYYLFSTQRFHRVCHCSFYCLETNR